LAKIIDGAGHAERWVSLLNVYYEYFCKLMWLSAKSLHVLDINIQNVHDIFGYKYALHKTNQTCIV
jgi:hypothetical protein